MEPIKLDCTYEERTSKKDGKLYKAIYIKLASNYERIVFPTVPEQVLLEQNYLGNSQSSSSTSPYDF